MAGAEDTAGPAAPKETEGEEDEESDAGSEDLEAESSGSDEEEIEEEGEGDEEMEMGEDGGDVAQARTHTEQHMNQHPQGEVMVH